MITLLSGLGGTVDPVRRFLLSMALIAAGPALLSAQSPLDDASAAVPRAADRQRPAPRQEEPEEVVEVEADAPSEPPVDVAAFMSVAELDEGGKRGLRVNDPRAMPGYTLFAPLNSDIVYLVDMDGKVVHSWQTDSAPGAWCYLLDDGTLLRTGREDEDPQFKGGGIGGRVQWLAPDGTVLWHWQWSGDEHQQHHDIEPLPNGNILIISWEHKDAREAAKRGRDPREVDRERGFWPDMVLEVKPVGTDDVEVVWEWHVWDHLVQDFEEALPDYGWIAEHPGLIDINGDHRDQAPLSEAELKEQADLLAGMKAMGYVGGSDDDEEEEGESKAGDWLHTNAVAHDPVNDLIVLSTPHFSELWVIDHSTTTEEAAGSTGGRFGKGGDILWRWGNPRRYGAGKDEDQQLFYQHDPTWVVGEHGELALLVFNNGRGREDGNYSSVDELVLPFDEELGFSREEGMAYEPADLAWTYSNGDGFYSAFISGAQRLENGNTLICSGAPGRIFEVTRDGEVVWDYRNPLGGEIDPPEHAGRAPPLALFRATRIGLDAPGVKALGL
jgi:hypothetical protein